MMRAIFAVVILSFASIASAPAQSASATAPLQIGVHSKLAVVLNPTSASITCDIAPGTILSAVTMNGGNQKPIVLSMTGDTTDFALSATSPPANVIVAAGGITSTGSSCATIAISGITDMVTVTATQ